jgi:hypothetical protein
MCRVLWRCADRDAINWHSKHLQTFSDHIALRSPSACTQHSNMHHASHTHAPGCVQSAEIGVSGEHTKLSVILFVVERM